MTVRAVCYARVSSTMQRDRETIGSQLRVLPEFIARQGWELTKPVNTYVDDGRTAKAGQLGARTGLADMLRDAALGLFDVVVVVDIDRLTRSEDLTERGAILGALQHANVKIASAMSGQVLDLSTSSGDLFTTLHAFFAAEWTRKHRERVMQGRITAVKRGRKPAGRKPYWLTYDRVTAQWSIDPVRGELARELFRRVADGESCRAIADDFHRRGEPKPRGDWNRTCAARMIRSPTALGKWTVDRKRALVLDVPRLIDDDLWHRAQAALNVSGHRGLRKTTHDYLLEGLGICGKCGAPIGIRSAVWDPRRNGRWSPAAYQCRGRRLFRIGGEQCKAEHVVVEDADRRAWAAIREELNAPELADEIAMEITGRDQDASGWEGDVEGYRSHLSRLERIEASVLERYRRGLISDNSLDLELGRIRRERDSVRSQLATAEKAQVVALDARARLDDARRTLSDLRSVLDAASFEVRRDLLELLVPAGGITFAGKTMKITLLVPRSSAARGTPGLVRGSALETHHETHVRIRVVA